MDITVGALQNAMAQSLEAYVNFLEDYNATNGTCYVFVEGKNDPTLYRSLIYQEISADKRVIMYPSGSKRNVNRIYNLLDWRSFSMLQIIFIIDRDLYPFFQDEHFFEAPNVYMTDYYAVENYIICKDVFESLSRDVLGFSNNKQSDIDKLMSLYECAQEAYEKALIPIMANIVFWKRHNISPANYNNYRPNFIEVKNGVYSNTRTEEDIRTCLYRESQVPEAVYDEEQVSKIVSEISGHYKEVSRGKYLIPFFCQFCNSLIRDAVEIGVPPPVRGRTICEADIWLLAAPRKRQIPSFQKFLSETVVRFFQMTTI